MEGASTMNVLGKRWCLGAAVLGVLLTLASSAQSRDGGDGDDWPMYGHDPLGTRFNTGEKTITPANVAGLKVLWQFATPSIVTGTPAVVGDTVFDGDTG